MNLINKNYDTEGYLMLRTEILQYLEEYQTVRNMMYVVTGTLLTIGIGFRRGYLMLIPLLVIIPSYFISINYEQCVNVAASYLEVFYENRKDYPIKWESRLRQFGNQTKQLSDQHKLSFNVQQVPYRVSALACVAVYLCNLTRNYLDSWYECFVHHTLDVSLTGVFDHSLGVAALIIVLMTIFKIRPVKYETCRETWMKIYKQEREKK